MKDSVAIVMNLYALQDWPRLSSLQLACNWCFAGTLDGGLIVSQEVGLSLGPG